MKLTDAIKGQCLSFVYYGGSTPGSERHARVEEVYDDSILAYDLDKMATRRFANKEASNVQLIPVMPTPSNMVEERSGFDDIRRALHEQINNLNGEDLARACKSAGLCEDAVFDQSTGEVVMAVAKPVAHLGAGEECVVTVVNKDDKCMYCRFYPEREPGRQISVAWSPCSDVIFVTPEQFVENLQKHLDI
jgi:hypothetical protein